ncbi:WcaI family glycosyltransferase [Marinococcus halotolerans]|uniref:WcaI family glycosyltransferase n=1 Tax=Marinococcus halotolerans TaxID=301092 RepID=UPI0003B669C6|nr:WcaI family glycosyltransferase [Marinococcus halotolerans]
MKILLYSINYAPEPTGTGKYNGELANWLTNQGHEVEVITSLPHYPQWKIHDKYNEKKFYYEEIDGVKIYRTPLVIQKESTINAKGRILMEMSFLVYSIKYWMPILLNKKKYDVVIAVSPPLLTGIFPTLYKKFRKVPWVFHIQDLQVDAAEKLNMLKSKSLIRFLYLIEKRILSEANKITTITEAMKKKIAKKGLKENKLSLFPNWSNVGRFSDDRMKNYYRNLWKLDSDDVLFMYAGNIGEKQGLDILLDVGKNITEKNIKIAIVGEGSGKKQLIDKAEELNLKNIHFLNVQPVEKLPELLAAADIHLIIQKREAGDLVMPSKLTNIVASGKASIITADENTTLHNIVKEFGFGIATPSENSQRLLEEMLKLAKETDLKRSMEDCALEYSKKYVNQNTILKTFEQELYTMIKT